MTSPEAEGRGVARALADFLEARAAGRGCRSIRLDCFSLNPRAVAFYEKRGYIRAGGVRFRKGEFHCMEKRLG